MATASVTDPFAPSPGAWRTFRLVTDLSFSREGAVQAWVPIPSFTQASWMKPLRSEQSGNAAIVQVAKDPIWGAGFVHAQWPAGFPENGAARTLRVTSYASTRDLAVDLQRPVRATALAAAQRERYLAATTFIPTDGIVKKTADTITAGATSDLEKARRIYAWIIENTYRKASVRGCGLGNIDFLLETGDLGGKCADINGLAVGLARASGIPARDLFGVRVAPSRFGYKSLGANSPTITKAQHCRAEFYLADYGWVPVDPADVRKVILEEPPGNLAANNPKVIDARETLFGAWEGNYVAYNDGHDIALPGSSGKPVPFLMYPQAEVDGQRLDSLDAAHFVYEIHSASG
ncbi:MAG TPA: transglutaminase-like domain-containing protein [Candidatus Baltobacteraceae bacterium]|nr:transglutaminase-like domain-containing protein [Candidatus Baltobacteraceae bacterium]